MTLKTIDGKTLKKWKHSSYRSGQHQVKLNFREVNATTGWHLIVLKINGQKQVYRIFIN